MGCLPFLLAVALGAPMADVWPYAAKRLPDGSLEYSYDLTAVKTAGGTPDAKATHGDEKVAAFLKALPREVKVKVPAGGALDVGAGRGPEQTAMATSFALIGAGSMSSENPLARGPGARLRPALDPEEPKVLVSAELVAWQVRALEDSALAAVEVDTEAMRRDLWSKVAERAVDRFKASQGDAREGALALAARVTAASACLDAARVPDKVKADGELFTAVQAELQRAAGDHDSLVPPPPWSWSRELTCAWLRARMLGRPFEQSRAGTGAVLVFLDVLERDPKLKAQWERIRQRRDRFIGAVAPEPANEWREKAKGNPAQALDAMSDFIESLPVTQRTPPPLVALGVTPFTKFLGELSGAERGAAWHELASAVQDGRVAPAASAEAGWPVTREATLAAFAIESKAVQFDSAWRDGFVRTFAALQGGHHEARGGGKQPERESSERGDLKLRLQVPPMLEVEPLADVFSRATLSLEQLVQKLGAENLGALKGLHADGTRGGDTLLNEAKRLIPRLKGLALLASPTAKLDAKEVAEARRFVAAWRSDSALARDVRQAAATPIAMASERGHAAIVGVTRQELTVTFSAPPKAEVQGAAAASFEANTAAEQRYIVPALVTVGGVAPASRQPIDRAAVKALVESVKRDPTRVAGAFAEELSGKQEK